MKALANSTRNNSNETSKLVGNIHSDKDTANKQEGDKSCINSELIFDMSQTSILPSSYDSIQPKLTINQPNDEYEQEADRVADRVMRMSENIVGNISFGDEAIQRKCTACEKEEDEEKIQMKPYSSQITPMIQTNSTGGIPSITPSFQSSLNRSKGSGSPLPRVINQFMSNAFNADFSHVRVHNNAQAHQMNRDIQARAFTNGSDIYFKNGQFNPNSFNGKQLLAHELTHVVQQSGNYISDMVQPAWDWKGAGLGVLAGAAGGALIGGLAGGGSGAAIGAGIGALTGGIVGGLIGGGSNKTVTINTTVLHGATDNSKRDITTSNSIFNRNHCSVQVVAGTATTLNVTQTSAILGTDNLLEEPSGNTVSTEEQSLTAINRTNNQLTAYYVPGFHPSKRGTSLQQPAHGVPDSLLMGAGAVADTFTHELCHILTRDRRHKSDPNNLMASGSIRNIGVDKLTSSQCNNILTNTSYPH